MSVKLNLDKLDICTSATCALHCLATPFIILLFPLAGFVFLEWEGTGIGPLVVSFFFAITSLVVSYVIKHRNAEPILITSIGFILFLFGRAFELEIVEVKFSILGGCFVILAYYRNNKLEKKIVVQ